MVGSHFLMDCEILLDELASFSRVGTGGPHFPGLGRVAYMFQGWGKWAKFSRVGTDRLHFSGLGWVDYIFYDWGE